MDLFDTDVIPGPATRPPLAARMRPKILEDFAGQDHIIGPGKLLRRAIESDQLSSLIFYGPPGTGKTTLARIIAHSTKATFHSINAVLAGVKDIREAIKLAKEAKEKRNQKFILFIDEVHRFNKSQQDALLPNVENGTLILIGATTENPYFEVNKALISRSRVFQLNPLGKDSIRDLVKKALTHPDKGYGEWNIKFDKDALEHIVSIADGDARAALNALELAIEPELEKNNLHITLKDAEESIQKKAILYDKDGDSHYDTISAFIKSIRGSDPDAALFWMAKMLYAGEDPRFIFRRMLISASEDVGLANPEALGVVVKASQAFEYVGMPEGRFHLAQACLYLATSPKSNSTLSLFDALKTVEESENTSVPNHLKDPSRDGEDFGHGAGYQYPHAHKDHWVAQQYLPDGLQNKVFYHPSDQGYEHSLAQAVQSRKELQLAAMNDTSTDLNFRYPTKKGLNDYWIRRSLNSTHDWLAQVREIMFKQIQLPFHSLVLDVTGDKGFLTWEACRLFSEGGVWSLCHQKKSYEQMKAWTSGFHFNYTPQHMLAENAVKDLGWLGKGHDALKFNLLMAYNPGQNEFEHLKLLLPEILEHHRGHNFALVFAEVDQSYFHPVHQVLQVVAPRESKLIADLQKHEFSFGNTDKQEKSETLEFLESLGLEGVSCSQHVLKTKRKLVRKQIDIWLEGKGHRQDYFAYLEKSLGPDVWKRIKVILQEKLPHHEMEWSQRFKIFVQTKRPTS